MERGGRIGNPSLLVLRSKVRSIFLYNQLSPRLIFLLSLSYKLGSWHIYSTSAVWVGPAAYIPPLRKCLRNLTGRSIATVCVHISNGDGKITVPCDADPYDHRVLLLLRRGCRDRRADGDGGRAAARDERAVRQQVRHVPNGMFVVAAAAAITGQRRQWLLVAVASDAAISTGWAAAAGEGRESQRLLLLLHRRERAELCRVELSLHAAAPGASSPCRCLDCWALARPRPQLHRLQHLVR